MKQRRKLLAALMALVLVSGVCFAAALSARADAASGNGTVITEDSLTFPLGMEVSFNGTGYLAPMIRNEDVYNFPQTNNITFSPGARSDWHSHGGMVILVTGGVGYYQEEGKPAQILRMGDVLEIAPGVMHWHGAAPNSWFSQMVIYDSHYEGGGEGGTVTDEYYASLETEEYAGRTVTDGNAFMFQRSERSSTLPTFSGPVYISTLLEAGNAAGAPEMHYVVFEPGVINNWHTHEGGQIMIATDGIGYHQIEGQPVEVLYPGDVAYCPPGVKHWHGGSADTSFAHIAVNTNPERPGVEWFDRISEAEYQALSTERTAYTDVTAGSWYADAVNYVTENNLMDPAGANSFAPNTDATRAALAVALYRAAGSPQVGSHTFSDIPAGSSYADAAAWAQANGVINGYGKGRFGGEDPITREQIVTILWRYMGQPSTGASQDFTDESSISAYAAQAVDWSRNEGVVNGYDDGRFGPQDHTTRAQLAAIIQRFLTNQTAQPAGAGVVRTTAGLVQGTNQNGVYRYLGIPYAQAAERFVPAEAAEPWEGIRRADSYGSISPQGAILGMEANGDADGTDNNCQNLNIWTPGVNDGQKRPVMVWLHGGGMSTGSGNEDMYDGENLSRSGDVVVVAVNHRLNLFGFLDLSAYGEKYKDSGNVGMMDIVSALEWVQDNIEAFGGDPDNVTVFGQSGGGAKVLALMTSPYAKGLFHKGIVQSGATETLGVTFTSKEASARLTQHILENLNISAENIEDLQTVSVARLQQASNQALQATADEFLIPAALGAGYAMEWGPVVDGDFLPTDPVTADSFASAGRDIPLLIGSTLNEWNFFPNQNFQSTPEIDAAVKAAYPNKPNLSANQVDTMIRLSMLKIMSHKADQGGANVYSYIFARDNSFHGAEIPFIFRNTDDSLAETVSQVWVNFARTGVPSADGLPVWEPYTRENGAAMLLNDQSELVHHHDRTLMGLLAPDYQY